MGVEFRQLDTCTALLVAAREGALGAVKYLVEHGMVRAWLYGWLGWLAFHAQRCRLIYMLLIGADSPRCTWPFSRRVPKTPSRGFRFEGLAPRWRCLPLDFRS